MKTSTVNTALAAALLLSTLNAQLSIAHAQGSLTPPGAPAPIMKTLAQIEPRTPISAAPFTITNSGSYYLTTNLTVASGNAITIATNGVTLDLGGFTISSTAASATGTGILLNSGLRNLTILNGFIQGGVTNNGSNIYTGPGFQDGISYSGITPPVNTRVAGVSVAGCSGNGIYLFIGDSTVVESCTVRTVGGYGMMAAVIKSSAALDCGNNAIYGNLVSDSNGQCNGNGYGLSAFGTAQNCYGTSGSYYGLSAFTALNCVGVSSSSYGLAANAAQNCYGYSSSNTGLYVNNTAQNCYGYCNGNTFGLFTAIAQSCYGFSSNSVGLYATTAHDSFGTSNGSGTGLSAFAAENCYGSSNTGQGLGAYIAQNCIGSSGSGPGLATAYLAIGCFGDSTSGTGLQALIGNSSHGVSSSGTAESVTYKYNMP
jgi:hypothetical protein